MRTSSGCRLPHFGSVRIEFLLHGIEQLHCANQSEDLVGDTRTTLVNLRTVVGGDDGIVRRSVDEVAAMCNANDHQVIHMDRTLVR